MPFAEVINRGYKKLSPCFPRKSQPTPGTTKRDTKPGSQASCRAGIEKLVPPAYDLELKVDRVAKQLVKARFHSSDRLKSYLGLIKETIEQASKTEIYLQTNNEAALALWQVGEPARPYLRCHLASVLLSLTLTVLICAYFSRTIMQRIATLSTKLADFPVQAVRTARLKIAPKQTKTAMMMMMTSFP
ncbi:MAG: hypothetical protein IPM93_25055 [Candidatus Obscuribacter sp.]|nr:hypothetical protein [Candidatus Obscuribacter sp.]